MPESGTKRELRHFASVDLPLPFLPIIAVKLPFSTESVASSSTFFALIYIFIIYIFTFYVVIRHKPFFLNTTVSPCMRRQHSIYPSLFFHNPQHQHFIIKSILTQPYLLIAFLKISSPISFEKPFKIFKL
mgnify:CR=1 FL=1